MTQRNELTHSEYPAGGGLGLTRRDLIGVAAMAAVGTRTLSAAEPPGTRPADWPCLPCLAVWQYDGYPAPGQESNSGLRIAAWADGTILFSPSPERLGKNLIVGMVDKADLEEMLKAIRQAGFFEAKRSYQVPDSSFAGIAVRDGQGSNARFFHEYLVPGFGGNLNSDAEYRQFVRMWKHTCGAIEALAPTRIEVLGERKEFRGYQVDKWQATAWRDEREWRNRRDK